MAVVLATLLVACTTQNKPDDPPTEPVVADCRCEDGCVSACAVDEDATTTYRKVPREPDAKGAVAQDPPEAFSLYEDRLDALDSDQIARVAEDLGLAADQVAAAFRGNFARGRGEELAVVSVDGQLAVYRDGSVIAETALGKLAGDEPVSAIQLVDERVEVVVQYEVDGVERLTVCRVIGEAIGRVFDMELGGTTVQFVHLGEERAIRVNGRDGSIGIYRWNPWEGMFRIPTPAPTSP